MNLTYIKNGETLALDETACVGCGACLDVCPHAVFSLVEGKARVAARGRCMECGACARNCPANAIAVTTGVGCAAAIIAGKILGTAPTCGDSGSSCGGGACCGGCRFRRAKG